MAFEPFRMLRIFREKKITTQTNTHTHIRRRLSIIIYWYEGNGKFHSPRKLPVSFIITPKITPGLSFFHCTFALLYGITWIGLRGWIFFWIFFYSAATSAKPSKLSTFMWPFNQSVAFIYWFFFVKTFVFITQKHIHQTIFRYEKEEREAKWLLWNLIELCGWKLFFWAFGSLVFFNFSAYGMSFFLSNMKQQHTIKKNLDKIKWNRNNKKSRIHL